MVKKNLFFFLKRNVIISIPFFFEKKNRRNTRSESKLINCKINEEKKFKIKWKSVCLVAPNNCELKKAYRIRVFNNVKEKRRMISYGLTFKCFERIQFFYY